MKTTVACLLVLFVTVLAAVHPLEGRWAGRIDTDRGQMQIGLELKAEGNRLTGALKTPHGDWPVTGVADSKGTYTVTCSTGDATATLVGTVKGETFSGSWKNGSYSSGTFTLSRAKS